MGGPVDIPEGAWGGAPEAAAACHGLPERFLYFPAQFWRHKNHSVVAEAVKRLRARGVDVFVAMSGGEQDFYLSDHGPGRLRRLLEGASGMKHLGEIPRTDVLQLMRRAVAVINPSSFEGFGLASEEAAAFGKTCVLSDIPALREQSPPGAIYAAAGDVSAWEAALERAWKGRPGPDASAEAAGRERYRMRLRASGEILKRAMEECCA
jgi:glycosyltransferase involved in cell wall biosynthesis